ncbi:MAG: outer membrane beta-barrel protein [Vicingaceae bacterium]|nr:outer membrane beta-barrel protein [Vicingaceae bacterium]
MIFNNLNKKTSLLLFVLFVGLTAFTQTVNLKGKVVDNENQSTMPGATVMLLNPSDSTFYKFGITKSTGDFSIKGAETGSYILQVSFIGYASYYKDVTLTPENKEVDFGTIAIGTKKELIETFDVVAEMVPVIINGDTVEFNAGAFKTQPEDNVKDLLKQLPGVEVDKDGKVTAQGEEVRKVLVDGKNFFGDDTKLATENLPADMVKKVQVYDDYSELSKITGVDDGDRTKTINLKIKKDRKKGLFGNVIGGSGLTANDWSNIKDENGLYSGKFNINKFKDNRQISTLGMINNTNEQGFSYRDYINFAGGASNVMRNGGGFRNLNNTSGVPLNNNPNDGFSATKAIGFNWNEQLSKNINLATSYFFNEIDKQLYRKTDRQYINDDQNNFNSFEQENQFELNRNHRINIKYDQDIDSTQDLIIKGDFSYSKGNINAKSINETNNANGDFLNSTNNNNQSTGIDFRGSGDLTYGKRFNKKGRSFVTQFSLGNSKNEKTYFVRSQNNFNDTIGNLFNLTTNQIQDENNKNLNYSGKVSFTEPLGKSKYLELSYLRRNNNYEYIKEFYDILGPNSEALNNQLSLDYDNVFVYDNYASNFKINTSKSNITIGAAAQRSNLEGKIKTTDFKLSRVQWNLLPSLKWKYSFTKSSRLTLNYNTNVNEPSLQQLQPTIDNSDPLNIYQGNPNLKTEYLHSGTLRFMSFNQFSFTNVFATLNASFTENKITNSQTLNNQFLQTTTPINVAKDLFLTGYFYFGTPVRAIKSKINIRLNSSYNKSILFINSTENNVDRITNGANFSIENRKKEKIDMSIGTSMTHTTTSYSLSNNLNQKYITNKLFADFLIDLKSDWTLSTEAEYTMYSGDQFVDNPDIPIWEASLSKRFLKGKSGLLKLSVYDIFNQNVGINRTNNLNYIEDERVTTLSRYVLLSFTYKIRRFGGKRKKKKDATDSNNKPAD